jgi:hypothetical protein
VLCHGVRDSRQQGRVWLVGGEGRGCTIEARLRVLGRAFGALKAEGVRSCGFVWGGTVYQRAGLQTYTRVMLHVCDFD